MVKYSVKLVDHTSGSEKLQPIIQKHLQGYFDEVFADVDDTATVTWGTAKASDTLVLHFVQDVESSYVSQKLPGNAHRADGGGFTRTQKDVTGSEFYKLPLVDGKPSQIKAIGYAKLAFHEGMHNKTGMSNTDLHGDKGGGGLASSPPHPALTDANKTLMREAMKKTNAQLQ